MIIMVYLRLLIIKSAVEMATEMEQVKEKLGIIPPPFVVPYYPIHSIIAILAL